MFKAALPLTLVAAVAVLARTWQLSQNDFGRQYYAAAVRSMLDSWHNFIFNSFDPAGFVSIDKPPVAIWLQVAGAKLFGFGALSILLAQVVAGVANVLLQTPPWLSAVHLANAAAILATLVTTTFRLAQGAFGRGLFL